jgi:hypothetical protein
MWWTTLGAERHVDLWMHPSAVHSGAHPRWQPPCAARVRTEAPVPAWDGGLGGGAGGAHLQRIDITRPSTMAPKPMAKFQAPSETMNGIWSPAT